MTDCPQLLDGITVLELGEGLPSALCGRLLADLGASVIKVEPEEGDWLRSFEPQSNAGVSLAHENLTIGKRVIRATSRADYAKTIQLLVRDVDAVLDHPESHIYEDVHGDLFRDNPALVYCRIRDDDYDTGIKRGEVGAQAVSGLAGYLGGRGLPPRTVRADVASTACAAFATQAILAGLIAKERTGKATNSSVSMVRSITAIKTLIWAAKYNPDSWLGFHCNGESGPIQSPYHAADGPVTFDLQALDPDSYRKLTSELGLDIPLENITPADIADFGDQASRYRGDIDKAIAAMSAADVGAKLQEVNGISVPYVSLVSLADHPQVQAIDPFRPAVNGSRHVVRSPIRSTTVIETSQRRGLGAEVLGDTTDSGSVNGTEARGGPLTGIRVLDLGIAGVGPWTATLLGGLGATVKKIESPAGDMILGVQPAQNGYRTTYAALNLGKHIISLDLKKADELAQFEGAIREADVLSSGFRPGVMDRLGLSEDRLHELNPRLVTFSSSGYGDSGPLARRRATDGHVQALSGFAAANGRAGEPEALRYNGFVDLLTSTFNCVAILAGLLHQQRRGAGVTLTNTMLGSVIFAEQVALASAQAGLPEPFDASERAEYAPSGAYVTKDGAIALEVRNDLEWTALMRVLEPHVKSPGVDFGSNSARCKNRDEMRIWIESALLLRPTRWWSVALTKAGVPCGNFVSDDENLRIGTATDGGFIERVTGKGIGEMLVGGLPWSFSDFSCAVGAPPMPGEDTSALPNSLSFSWIKN